MKKIWRADWTCCRMKLFELPAAILAEWFFGFLMILLIMAFPNRDNYAPLGSCLGAATLFIGECFFAFEYGKAWSRYGAMGVRRKDFFSYMVLRQLITIVGSYMLLLGLTALEQWMLGTLHPGILNLKILQWLHNPGLAAVFLLLCLLYALLGGALAMQYSDWVSALFHLSVITLAVAMIAKEDMRKLILSVPTGAWICLGFAIAAAVSTVVLKINRKMVVS